VADGPPVAAPDGDHPRPDERRDDALSRHVRACSPRR
jgi:hypothetical protein